jgi:hypothetical protein
MNELPQKFKGKSFVHSWKYKGLDKRTIGIVGRYEDENGEKDIIPFFKRKDSNWLCGIDIKPRPLFGLNLIDAEAKDKVICVVEGEKAAAALWSIGVRAVTSVGGSKAADMSDWTVLNSCPHIYILPDNDKPGEDYAAAVYRALSSLPRPPKVKVVRLPGLSQAGDVVDWLQTLAPGWDGYCEFPADKKTEARQLLSKQLKESIRAEEVWPISMPQPLDMATWLAPNKIVTKVPSVDLLSAELMPDALKDWFTDVSCRMQTPPDFVAVTSLVVLSSIIGAGCTIRPKEFDGWSVIPNLWGVCIGRPSVLLKSPSMNEVMGLLARLQNRYEELHRQAMASFQIDGLVSKSEIDDIKAQLAKAAKAAKKSEIDTDADNVTVLKRQLIEMSSRLPEEPIRRLFKTNETSIQSMTVLQEQNPRGLLVFRDELVALLTQWDQKDGADERAYFLEGWNGNGSYTDYKIGRGLTDAKRICISLIGSTQPDKLRSYLCSAAKGNNDGLVQRFQLAVWPDEPKKWLLVDRRPDRAAKDRVYAIMEKLAEIDFTDFGAVLDEPDCIPYFRFNDAAQAVFNEWLTELQTRKIVDEDNPLMAEHFGKYRSLMPSLALIFHCIEIADGQSSGAISEKSTRMAVAWCNYLESHARRVYSLAERLELESALTLCERIKSGKLPSPFTTKMVYDNNWHSLRDKESVEAACNVLVDENWLKICRKPKNTIGRPPLPEYFINPAFSTKTV